MDRQGLRIALVIDGDHRLLGTLTDGDVRRALLRELSLDRPVAEAMCRTPRVARQNWGREAVLALLNQHELLHAPVLDDDDRVVGLETIHGLLQRTKFDNAVFLMAGGFGTRLKPLTDECPKPLIRIGGKPILEIIMESFIASGFHRFFISTHYKPEMIHQHFGDGSLWNVSIEYVHEEQPLGTAGALGMLPPEASALPLVMMNGDLLTRLDFAKLVEFHSTRPAAATVCVCEYTHQVPYGVVTSNAGILSSIEEKPIQRCFVNAGIYVLSPELVHGVEKAVPLDMPSLIQSCTQKNATVNVFPIHEYWLDVGRIDDLERAQSELELSP